MNLPDMLMLFPGWAGKEGITNVSQTYIDRFISCEDTDGSINKRTDISMRACRNIII